MIFIIFKYYNSNIMGNSHSEVFDDYLDNSYMDRPPMIVSVYKGDNLLKTFEVPSGFDLDKYVEKHRKFHFKSCTSYTNIDEYYRQGYIITTDETKYIGLYKIDSNSNNYISEDFKNQPQISVTVYERESIVDEFTAPIGFDLNRYIDRLPFDKSRDVLGYRFNGIHPTVTSGPRSYFVFRCSQDEVDIKEPYGL
jgi:hypothetical protein